MEILGKDTLAEAYRVAVEIGGAMHEALVTDALLSSEYGRDTKVSHTEAYEWIAAHQHDLTDAIRALLAGNTPRAPFQALALAEESK